MSNEILNSILKEYDKSKLDAELDLEKRKELLYNKFPRLLEIENELNSTAISIAKNILSNNLSSVNQLNKKVESLKEEKANLLNKNNISNDYLKPHYSCNLCNDTGYVMQNNNQLVMCKCLKQKLLNFSYDNSNISNIKRENFSTFNENLFSDKVDSPKYKFNISPRENIINIKDSCMNFIDNFDNPDCKNLLFSGNTGLRKNFYV